MIYQWDEVDDIPNKPGVYAWYYSPDFSDKDIDLLKINIKQKKEEGKLAIASEEIHNFLYERVFKYFQEEPYKVALKGSLKPPYSGQIDHKPSISPELVERILENPDRIQTIRKVLESSVPLFSSPIYIGMSSKLGSRIAKHKKLIHKYRSASIFNYVREIELEENQGKRDQSFAFQVYKRNLAPTRLSVATEILDVSEKVYIDVENILNRVCYPILGRN